MGSSNLQQNIDLAFQSQVQSNKTFRSLEYRKALIQKLLDWMILNENKIKEAIQKDFKKPEIEIELTEIWVCIREARYMLKNLKRWMKKERVSRTLTLITAKSYIIRQPKGIVLIIAPWNYPFQLTIMPLLAAIAAGNSVFLKPSEKTPHTSRLIYRVISELFESKDVSVFEGGKETVSMLLEKKFDHILYTGGTEVGQIIMEKAATTLTPVTLELGGKCPALIDATSNIYEAAKKITYFKFMNAGQTCVAPDYILIEKSIKDEFINHCKSYLLDMYGDLDLIQDNPDYCRIVDKDHSERLNKILKDSIDSGSSLEFGGIYNKEDCFMSPTIISTSFRSSIMKEEIFGPILPIIEYESFDSAINQINSMDSPLAGYIFSNNRHHIDCFVQNTQSGGVCVNDVSIHLVHEKLPFGGVGKSGIGKYHGKFGFDELSNIRPVIKNIEKSPLKMLHPPYKKKVKKAVNMLKKLL